MKLITLPPSGSDAMKTQEQIESLLSRRKPLTEKDDLSIIQWCRKRKLYVHFPDTGDVGYDALPPITFEEFQEWYEAPQYELGDVVGTPGGEVYLISDYIGGETVSRAWLSASGEFSDKPVAVKWDSSHRKVDTAGKQPLQRAMSAAHVTWNPFRNKLMAYGDTEEKKYYVTMWVVDEKVGTGIFKEVDSDGNLVLYCFSEGEDHIELDNHYVFGPASDYSIRAARIAERSSVIQGLNSTGMCWNGRLKRLEPMNLRRKKGEAYFYVDSLGRTKKTIEQHRLSDETHYRIGNYFHLKEDAEFFKNRMVVQRNEILLGKLSPDDE